MQSISIEACWCIHTFECFALINYFLILHGYHCNFDAEAATIWPRFLKVQLLATLLLEVIGNPIPVMVLFKVFDSSDQKSIS